MGRQHSIIFASAAMVCSLICMEVPDRQSSDLGAAKLSIFAKSTIDFEDPCAGFKVLIDNNEFILRSLVAIEQGGKYCEALCQAEALLQKIAAIGSNNLNGDFAALVSKKFKMDFICCVTNKQEQRKWLMDALQKNYKGHVEWVLKDNCYVVNSYGSFDPYKDRIITPLHHMLCQAADGSIDYEHAKYNVETLLIHRANPNARDDAGNTPMHHASTPELVMLLLQFGAKCDEHGEEGRTPLHNHIRMKNWEVVRCLLNILSQDAAMCYGDENGNILFDEAVRQNAPMEILCMLSTMKTKVDFDSEKLQIFYTYSSFK